MINFPIMAGLSVVARPLVITLVTAKWLECVPLLQLLCMVGILLPLQRINLNLIVATGQSALFLKLELARTTMAVVFISIAGFYGIKTMIISQIAAMAATWYINTLWTGLSYTFRKQLVDVLPYFLASCAMAGGMIGLERLRFGSDLKLLTGQILIGACLLRLPLLGLPVVGFLATQECCASGIVTAASSRCSVINGKAALRFGRRADS